MCIRDSTEATAAETLVLPYNDLDAVREAFAAHEGRIAAVITEASPANMGVVPPDPGFNAGLREITRAHGALMIFDEVLTGFLFRQSVQLVHTDSLTKDFLYQLAASLHAKQEMALVGAGPKGNQPLVVREGGSPYRAFLFGETGTGAEADHYRLLLLLTDQELKRPA